MAFCNRSFMRVGSVPVGSAAGTPNQNQAHSFFGSTDDAAPVVEAAGYFNGARGLITIGSKISMTMNVAAGAPVYKEYVVTAVPSAPGNVTVALQTATAG